MKIRGLGVLLVFGGVAIGALPAFAQSKADLEKAKLVDQELPVAGHKAGLKPAKPPAKPSKNP